MTSLRPFFSFYGSKWRLAPKYPEPMYDTIVEPFAGSAGYSLRYPDHNVILFEADPVLIGIWRWLISASVKDIQSLPVLTEGESLDDYSLPQEVKWLMGFWVNQASVVPCTVVTKYADNPSNGKYIARYIERAAHQVESIRHWKIVEAKYADIPNGIVSWFIDPPYQVKGNQYRYRIDNYQLLGDWCKSRKGQVIVCENKGADWLPFRDFAQQQGITHNGTPIYSKEVVWISDENK